MKSEKDLDDFDWDERADFYAFLYGGIIYSFLLIAALGIFLYLFISESSQALAQGTSPNAGSITF